MNTDLAAPVHPGEILLEDFIKPAGITADTALRLGRYCSTTSEFRMNLQLRFDLDVASDASRRDIERSLRPRHAA